MWGGYICSTSLEPASHQVQPDHGLSSRDLQRHERSHDMCDLSSRLVCFTAHCHFLLKSAFLTWIQFFFLPQVITVWEVLLCLVLQGLMGPKRVCRIYETALSVLQVRPQQWLNSYMIENNVSLYHCPVNRKHSDNLLIYKYFSQGFYCLEGSSQRPTSHFLCPQGFFCEEGTASPHGSPCPAGTAGEQLGQTSRAACKRCKEGWFCPTGKSQNS